VSGDRDFLIRALELARSGFGAVAPNPPVGAVVVAQGEIVGEGYHARCGGPHAEVVALDAAGERARGATLYVSLEPCAHQGKTGPCTERIIHAGVTRVVHAIDDPNPQVAGKGLKLLAAAGVAVGQAQQPEAGQALIAPFHAVHTRGRPYTVLKWATSLDGKIATHTGESQWISGEVSRRTVHRLRGLCQVVAVGSGTAAADDPRLTVRDAPGRQPARLVVDSQARLSRDSQLARTASEHPTLIAHLAGHEAPALEALGCELLGVGPDAEGRVDLPALWRRLADRNLQSVLVEGGGQLSGALVEAGLVDAVLIFVAPRLIGGDEALGPLGGRGVARLADALQLRIDRAVPSGDDWMLLAAGGRPWEVLRSLCAASL